MKTLFKNGLLLITALVMSFTAGSFIANAFGAPQLTAAIGAGLFTFSLIPKGQFSLLMAVAPDVSALTTSFVKFGGAILRKQVNSLMLGSNVTKYTNVNQPIAMPKLSAVGNPRPYTAADATTNGAAFTDRVLTAFQSKWDFDVDAEQYRNTYLAYAGALLAQGKTPAPFYQYILDQVGTELMAQLNDSTLFFGVRNAAGTTAAALCDGWVTILKAAVTATTLTADTIGTPTSSNAVTKVETFLAARPAWWREKAVTVKCSYAMFDAYKQHYRTLNAYAFNPNDAGVYHIDGWANAVLEPVSGLGANMGLLGVANSALCFGTDGENIQVAASLRRNIVEVRLMFPMGTQVADLDCVAVSDILVA